MPATDTLVLSRCQRRLRRIGGLVENICGVLSVLAILTFFGGMITLTVIEVTVQYNPKDCFDASRDCEVLSVTHVYNVSDLTCTDSFVYVWKFFNSPVLFEQVERRRRNQDECLLDLDFSERNATFTNGTNTCFRFKQLFAGYEEYFNCAPVLESNNATVGRCQTLFDPVSTYDASFFVVVMAILASCCLCQVCFEFPEDDFVPAEHDFLDEGHLGAQVGQNALFQGGNEDIGEEDAGSDTQGEEEEEVETEAKDGDDEIYVDDDAEEEEEEGQEDKQ